MTPGREMNNDAEGVAIKVSAKLAVKSDGREDVPVHHQDPTEALHFGFLDLSDNSIPTTSLRHKATPPPSGCGGEAKQCRLTFLQHQQGFEPFPPPYGIVCLMHNVAGNLGCDPLN